MDLSGLELSILGPAFIAGMIVLASHVPLGREVLSRGIIFIDLAVAQIAGLGVIAAHSLGLADHPVGVQVAALVAALAGAGLLTWCERRFAEVQEALIGVSFVLAATLSILLLADNPHGGDQLRELLVGQILWVSSGLLWAAAVVSALVLGLWFGLGPERIGRTGFYLLFAVVVTFSVQLVGVYLVFASLIVPALATRALAGRRALLVGWALGAASYGVGLVASALWDLPTGALIVWALAVLGAIMAAMSGRAMPSSAAQT
jgi:zinc/manganese transport system permease protein